MVFSGMNFVALLFAFYECGKHARARSSTHAQNIETLNSNMAINCLNVVCFGIFGMGGIQLMLFAVVSQDKCVII